MLPGLIRIILVSWCVQHALARPARRTVRLFRTRSTTTGAPFADQAVEGSSLVEEFVQHQDNTLSEIRRIHPRRRFLYEPPFYGTFPKRDYNTLDGVVTLGESRSYSVMKHPRSEVTLVTSETTTEITTEATTESVGITSAVAEPVLLTAVEPYAPAVQRSHFSVDEAVHAPLSSTSGSHDPVPYSSTTAMPSSTVQPSTKPADSASSVSYFSHENSSPISYRTSLRTATSGSSVSFFRQLPIVQPPSSTTTPAPSSTEEISKTETRVESVREEAVPTQRLSEQKPVINEEKSYQFTNVHDKSFHHVQVTHLDKRPQSEPAKIYGKPEENYEVDEALSVRSNGRVHGVQTTAAPDSNKFGYVVEGRNFKKYRVEERTNDGFIVGEYGVVRHDDGSLRGVRYTADSTINPRLIYDALVKFLSL